MNIQSSYEYPTRPAEFINRSAEVASRFAGICAFGMCLLGIVYMMAR